jgi:hypothetical protein
LTTAERLLAHVVGLAGEIGDRNVFRPGALEAAAEYIVKQWSSFGYRVNRQEYQVKHVTCANLQVERPGFEPTGGILLIGAHYDSVRGCPAANDNGSGVAALLELARRFAEVEPARTVRFVAFANEEPPFFMTHQQGSIVYARAARQRGDDIRLMASLETMGYFSDAPGSQRYPPLFRYFYPDRGNFLGLVSDFGSRPAMLHATAGRGLSRRLEFPAGARGDVPLDSGRCLERPSVVLARGLSGGDDHGHGVLSLSLLPHSPRHTG